jgi:hypothetical protein
MFACPECRKRLSESAASCPKCGAVVNTEVVKKAKDAEKRGFMVFITIAAIVVVPLVGLAATHEKSATQKSPTEWDETHATVFAKMAVEKKLKSPSTAEFPWSSEFKFTHHESTWHVRGYVDAHNSFGGMLRKHWIVQLTEQPGGSAEVVKVSFF